MTTCKVCGTEFSGSNVCPDCGAKVVDKQSSGLFLTVLIGGLVLFLIVMIRMSPSGSSSGMDEKSQARYAIDLCWENQRKKSLPPDQQRFIAGACEMMEQKFVEKYRHKP